MSETDAPAGIDVDGVTRWFGEHVPQARAPLAFDRVTGGRSNLTFIVSDADGSRWVLRRPPLHGVLPSAHDMGREHRVMTGLGPTGVPVPRTLGYTEDESITGAPFYVMEHVEGLVIRDQQESEQISEPVRRRAGESIADTLAVLHSVDPSEVGLGDLGKPDGYIARQLRRWHGQWEQSKTRELPVMDSVHAALVERIPEQGPARIVHGDYRLDNAMISAEGDVVAVLDWELCTLGDPMADVGLLMTYWAEPGDDENMARPGSATRTPGYPTRAEMAQRYAERSGRDISTLPYYVAFGYWKLAAILEGVYSRYMSGAYGEIDDQVRSYEAGVRSFAEQAAALVDQLD